MTPALAIAEYGLREALRRKVFVVVCVLSVAFVGPSGGIVTVQSGPRTTTAASVSSCETPPASRSFRARRTSPTFASATSPASSNAARMRFSLSRSSGFMVTLDP